MKNIGFFTLLSFLFILSCEKAVDIDVSIIPNEPFIKSTTIAYMETSGLIKGNISQENSIDTINYIDSVIVKDRSVDLTNIWAQTTLETGCKIEPLDDAPPFGKYGDFSKPVKYRVTAPSGRVADWTLFVGYYTPQIGCLADRWVGNITCTDEIYPSYSSATCTGEKINDDCSRLNITFDFWADSGAKAIMELELGDIDMETFIGEVTLLNDVTVTSYGSTMTFHSGSAGTYNASANELNLAFEFSGYDIGGGTYNFTIKQSDN